MDTPGHSPPQFLDDDTHGMTGELLESSDTATSRYLIGSVAIGVVLVSRDQGAEMMTVERTQILQQVQAGLDWLADAESRARNGDRGSNQP